MRVDDKKIRYAALKWMKKVRIDGRYRFLFQQTFQFSILCILTIFSGPLILHDEAGAVDRQPLPEYCHLLSRKWVQRNFENIEKQDLNTDPLVKN
ncbi:hypothetical protein CHS0354_012027 [Potamilus streckersoni]|uniref:Uncharacterized protein n=1 Tax=Potamilus streckersoni TaxID=2493646 RepID=A0AAE0WG05_9BIVA|nr:hypothetical protein CHS0354_012027 [Potamilus streckersoni]